MRAILLKLIRIYQLVLSPVLGSSCRFHPTCSQYALDAIDTHGSIRGTWLAMRRVGRCHPWHPGGHDPVPETVEQRTSERVA